MAAKFISLQTNPILRLVSRGVIFCLLALLVIDNKGNFWFDAIFLIAAALMYFRPALRSLTFTVSFFALIFLPFLLSLPISSLITAGLLGMAFAILSGVKNLEFIGRKGWYTLAHFSILALYAAVIVYSGFSAIGQILEFALFLLLFREAYKKTSPLRGGRLWLTSGVMTLLSVELLGILTLLPVGFVPSAALFILIMYALFNTYLKQLNGQFSRNLLLRNVTILTLSSLLVMALSNWTLY